MSGQHQSQCHDASEGSFVNIVRVHSRVVQAVNHLASGGCRHQWYCVNQMPGYVAFEVRGQIEENRNIDGGVS